MGVPKFRNARGDPVRVNGDLMLAYQVTGEDNPVDVGHVENCCEGKNLAARIQSDTVPAGRGPVRLRTAQRSRIRRASL